MRQPCVIGAKPLITLLVFGLALQVLPTLLLALFEIARHFHNHFGGMSVALDQRIDHHPHLIEADVNRGVGYFAETPFDGILGVACAEADMALQVFAVVRQGRQDFATGGMANVAVVIEARCQYRLVVGDHLTLKLRQDASQRLGAKTAIAFWQTRVRNGLGMRFVHAGMLLQPPDQLRLVLFGHNLHHDSVLFLCAEVEPFGPEMLHLAQDGAGCVALEFLTLEVFKVELHRATQANQFLDLREAAFDIALERIHQPVALLK
ncbi:hypothetical protein GALL_391940 [mine drainage metagenome]|uniref:Uncharacterized protein n=1 Tax=mine drainage metagenome TaxID=410659 RepID=A0A1J5QT51_9ZZZZ